MTRVLASGYLMWAELSSLCNEVPLSSFGTTCPFQILCYTQDLHIYSGKDVAEAQLAGNITETSSCSLDFTSPPSNSYMLTGDPITSENPADHMPTYSEGLVDNGEDYDPKFETRVDEAKQDSQHENASLEELLLFILGDECVRSQVLGDT